MKKAICMIKLFRLQASIAMNLFIFLPIYLCTHDLWLSLINTLPFVLLISGEIAFNDCCDIKKDAINKPHRPLVSGLISVKFALVCTGIVLVGASVMSYIIYIDSISRLIIFLSSLLILSLYNLKLGWIALGKAFITGGCTALCLSFICTFIRMDKTYILFLVAAFFFISGRELMMDIRDIEGDRLQDYNTIAVRLGRKKTVMLSFVLIALSNMVCFVYVSSTNVPINYCLFAASILIECGIITVFIITKNNKYRNKAIIFLWVPMILMLSILLISLPKPI